MTDRLITFCFGEPGDNYRRMADVLEYTAHQHCPGWSIEVNEMPRAPIEHYSEAPENFIFNVQKVDAWADAVQQAEDGDRLCILDCDTMILGPLDPVWDREFDFAYTGKRGKLVLNSGVIFVRVSATSRRFVRAWAKMSHDMIADIGLHRMWRRKSPGMTQPALTALLRSSFMRRLEINILELDCQTWNCEESGWGQFNKDVRILHIKGHLRSATFGGAVTARRLRLAHLARLWHSTEAELTGSAMAAGAN